MVMSYKERLNTAYHESGHAIVGRLMPVHDPVYKVSIIPRGRALGVTMFLPAEDRYSHSRLTIIANICSLYGGRIAEELTLGKDGVTTGASNDIQRATSMARNMVTKWGLSEELGPLLYDEEGDDPFGRGYGQGPKPLAEETQRRIDTEVRKIIDECYQQATALLEANRDILDNMTQALMKYETINSDQISELMERTEVTPPEDWVDENDSPAEGDDSGSSVADAQPETDSTVVDIDKPVKPSDDGASDIDEDGKTV
jgi:cell division protease FtsH